MGALAELELTTGDDRILLISPPDSVLAEAGTLKPRPTVVSSLIVARPSSRMAWWAEERYLGPESLSRLLWLISVARGRAWIVADPEEPGATPEDVRAALAATELHLGEELALADGSTAIPVSDRAAALL